MAPSTTLHDLFYRVLNEYGDVFAEVHRTKNFTNSFGNIIRRDIPAAISSFPEIDKTIYRVEGKCGFGRWASVPYIPVLDKRITTSAKKGAYIVYLINKDTKEMTLAFGIGTTEGVGNLPSFTVSASKKLTPAQLTNLRERCTAIRNMIGNETWLTYNETDNIGAESYDAACVYNKKYTLATLPDDETLKADLLEFLEVYKIYYAKVIGGDSVPTKVLDHWPSGARDTTEFPKVAVSIDASMRDHLKAFTLMDGVGWTDYDAMNDASGSNMTDSRLRTYRKMYEKFGLLYHKDDKLMLSRLGHQMAALESSLDAKKNEVLNQLRITAANILSRYQLRNPADNDPLPSTCDVLPAIVFWKSMRSLDNKLHPEEVNRVLLRVMQMDELDDAIETIKTSREELGGKYIGVTDSDLETALGRSVHTDQVQARIAPWFSFLGWGGLIIQQAVDEAGFRNLVSEAIPMIDEILENPPVYYEAADESDWLEYYIGKDTEASAPTQEELKKADDPEVKKPLPVRAPRGKQLWDLNQILYGAPGTGKTFSSAEYASAIVEKRTVNEAASTDAEREGLMRKYQGYVDAGYITFTTFHQSYGYEDFIQGIKPDTEKGTICFNKTDGVFKKIADRAMEDNEHNYVIIVDEINRGNISKIFGELITLIEADKRWGEVNQISVTLPMGDVFAVPNNLYIIGTMNSADKSISLVDTALRRRFAFVEMPPMESVVKDATLRDIMHKLNSYLNHELRSSDLLIGHAYFVGKNMDDLEPIMNNSIIPLLYEYFYDDESKVRKALECLDGTDYEIEPKLLRRVRIKRKATT